MADLLSILSSAQSSLAAQRALQATASHNVENANTPGYARQRAELVTVAPAEMVRGAYVGSGATVGAITQARDRFLEAQIPHALGAAASSTAESDALAAVHALDPGASGGLGDALAGFYSGLRALAQDPANSSLRSGALGAAQALATSFQRTRGALEDARTGLDQQLDGLASEANTEAAAVADLNGRIRTARAGGAAPNDLLDLRQKHLDRLAELTGAALVPTSDGDVNVALPGGVALVSGTSAGVLSTIADTANGGHLALQLSAPGGGSPVSPTAAPGGQLGGTLTARDGAMGAAVDGLDGLAGDLASQVNTVHQAGTGLDGSTQQPLFTFDATRGAAATLAVAFSDPRTLATGNPADPRYSNNAQALVASEDAILGTSNATAESTLSAITADFGTSAEHAKSMADQDGALRDQLSTLRESVSGVSIDDEMIQMQQAQRGYEAITKVIQVADAMMDTLLKLR